MAINPGSDVTVMQIDDGYLWAVLVDETLVAYAVLHRNSTMIGAAIVRAIMDSGR